MEHLSDHDLERYHLGMVKEESELAPFEEHLLGCAACAKRAEESAQYVDTIRAALVAGKFDLLPRGSIIAEVQSPEDSRSNHTETSK